MAETNFIDEVMGFDPAAAVTAFENSSSEKNVNPNVYKTNPTTTVNEDGHYHSRIRVLLNPYNVKRSIVHQTRYSLRDQNGFFRVISSLSDGDKNCPIFKGWKKLWFATIQDPENPAERVVDQEKRDWAKAKFDKSESDWVLVQIIEDENKPELVGTFKLMKLPKAIYNRLKAKMNPTDPKKQKQPLMDYLFGPVLEMDVVPGPDDPSAPERKQRETSYDLCDFDTDPTPIIQTDGTPLFTDEEIEMIEEYNQANIDLVKAKTDAKRAEAEAKKEKLAAKIRPLYGKAIEYIKTYAIDPVMECGYTPWSEELTARVNAWLEKVTAMQDPQGDAAPAAPAAVEEFVANEKPADTTFDAGKDEGTDLPF